MLNDEAFVDYNEVAGQWAQFAVDDAGNVLDVPKSNTKFDEVVRYKSC